MRTKDRHRQREAEFDAELEQVREDAERNRQFVRDNPGFSFADPSEPMPPLACDYCGCLVSLQRADTHRARCAG